MQTMLRAARAVDQAASRSGGLPAGRLPRLFLPLRPVYAGRRRRAGKRQIIAALLIGFVLGILLELWLQAAQKQYRRTIGLVTCEANHAGD
ncbi:hypothetical protein [Victivallis sp. Marseille-Q1083]|uniref:hypothetical protein n=1 Tax=Victivallis sp. Marseille-Q1083 TaxID=2717288 RepID=UPI00158D0B5A|nr:hypothetical protein [Victivallis sp. Marseille-Q1083]